MENIFLLRPGRALRNEIECAEWGDHLKKNVGHCEAADYNLRKITVETTGCNLMQNEQNEVWTAPDFEAVSTNMECTAYSETL